MLKALSNSADCLIIETSEGRFEIPAALLRQNCPCAQCKSFQKKTLKVLDYSPTEIKILKASPAGNYGIKIYFSDGHSFGIFTFEHLLKLANQSKI